MGVSRFGTPYFVTIKIIYFRGFVGYQRCLREQLFFVNYVEDVYLFNCCKSSYSLFLYFQLSQYRKTQQECQKKFMPLLTIYLVIS